MYKVRPSINLSREHKISDHIRCFAIGDNSISKFGLFIINKLIF